MCGELSLGVFGVDAEHGPWAPVAAGVTTRDVALVHTDLRAWPPARIRPELVGPAIGAETERYQRLTAPASRARLVASRMLVKRAVGAAVGVRWDQLELAHTPGGKMHVLGLGQLEINLSHTGRLLVVGLTRLGALGIDVEAVDRPLLGTGVEHLMCSPVERARLATLPPDEANAFAVRCWTLKEAYTKALGQGLVYPFAAFGFTPPGTPGPIRLTRVDGSVRESPALRFATAEIEGHAAAVAVWQTAHTSTGGLQAKGGLDRRILASVQRSLAKPVAPRA